MVACDAVARDEGEAREAAWRGAARGRARARGMEALVVRKRRRDWRSEAFVFGFGLLVVASLVSVVPLLPGILLLLLIFLMLLILLRLSSLVVATG